MINQFQRIAAIEMLHRIFTWIVLLCVSTIMARSVTPKNIICTRPSPTCMTITTCKMVPIDEETRKFTFDSNIVTQIQELWIHVKQYKKKPGQKFQPGALDTKLNVCDFTKNLNNSMITKFVSYDLNSILAPILHPCPYKGPLALTVDFKSMELNAIEELVMETGDYKTYITLFNKKQTCLTVAYYSTIE